MTRAPDLRVLSMLVILNQFSMGCLLAGHLQAHFKGRNAPKARVRSGRGNGTSLKAAQLGCVYLCACGGRGEEVSVGTAE